MEKRILYKKDLFLKKYFLSKNSLNNISKKLILLKIYIFKINKLKQTCPSSYLTKALELSQHSIYIGPQCNFQLLDGSKTSFVMYLTIRFNLFAEMVYFLS